MSEFSRRESARPDVSLSRRSLIAAAGILATVGPGAAGKALAFSSSKPTKITWDGGRKPGDPCQSKCVICFLSGTRLQAPGGEVAIDDLRIGNLLLTKSGAARPIRWIGKMTVERGAGGRWPGDARPVRVARDAFGPGTPRRDLYLSRAHMVHLDGILVPIGDLINGRTIALAEVDADRLEYFHVQFETHDVVLAEGAPCESLRLVPEKLASFDNCAEYLALYGHPLHAMAACAPVASFSGGRSEIKSRLKSALAPLIDIRDPLDIVRDDLETRALSAQAA